MARQASVGVENASGREERSRYMHGFSVSKRALNDDIPWLNTDAYLNNADGTNKNSRAVYLSGLRLFADWVQTNGRDGYDGQERPLDPADLTPETVELYLAWLEENRAENTAGTYRHTLAGFLAHLDKVGKLAPGVGDIVPPGRALKLPLSQQQLPDALPWLHTDHYLDRVGGNDRTQATYLSGLRLFADWVQVNERDAYADKLWPLDPAHLTTATVLLYQDWLPENRAAGTADTYRRILAGYLEHLQSNGLLPPGFAADAIRPQRISRLPLSKRPAPAASSWLHADLYLALIAEKSENTSLTYRNGLRLFADWVYVHRRDGYEDQVWPLNPATLTTETIIEYDRWLIANRARRTRLTYLAALMGYLNELEASRMLPAGIRLGELRARFRKSIHRKARESSRVVALDRARQDVPKIVRYYDTLPLPPEFLDSQGDTSGKRLIILRNRAVVNTLYSTAMRVEEALQLNRDVVRDGLANNALIIGKGERTRAIHLQDYAREAIQAYLAERKDDSPALFVSHSRKDRSGRIVQRTVQRVINQAVEALGLNKGLSPHDFRHYKATLLLRRGMSLASLQEYLGHSDISITRRIYAPVLGIDIVRQELNEYDVSPAEATDL